ncbi:MAG: DNA circularization N-terminal domain-containing protein, partial [Myxococcales bacterium]|nr:DNA circularization N-terminal domain-containing protein [Myxococcales bacterium]
MSVRLGDIELTRLQGVEVDEGRNLVEHRVPGGSGSVFQDLGRGALRLTMTGLLLGEGALQEIETLRAAQAESEPLQFSGDIAAGSELTDVIIEDFRVEQVPGYTFRYEFVLRVREWTEPPAPAGAALANVDAEIAGDAAGWNDSALALGGALDNPGGLAGLLSGDGSLLSRIDIGELAQAVIGAIGGLDPS